MLYSLWLFSWERESQEISLQALKLDFCSLQRKDPESGVRLLTTHTSTLILACLLNFPECLSVITCIIEKWGNQRDLHSSKTLCHTRSPLEKVAIYLYIIEQWIFLFTLWKREFFIIFHSTCFFILIGMKTLSFMRYWWNVFNSSWGF